MADTSETANPPHPQGTEGAKKTSRAAAPDHVRGKFLEGSIFGHVVTMTGAGSVGLMAVFFVDLANLFYISLLGETELTAAVGYATTIMFFNTSVSIGLMIGGTAIVARAIGAGNGFLARRRAGSALTAVILIMTVIVSIIFDFIPELLTLIGSEGRSHQVATGFLHIVVPSLPLLGIAIMLGGLLRANGYAKASMMVTLSGGIASALLDPLFIFGFDLGVTGAAIASVLSRLVMIGMGLYGTMVRRQLFTLPRLDHIREDWLALFAIAGPAVLTNVANPVGNAYITAAIAPFGDGAVAGWTIVGRIIPLAYTALFALSGSVGPIFAQNLGGGRSDRVRQTLLESMKFVVIYASLVWLVLFLTQDLIIAGFKASGEAADIVAFFCTYVVPSGIFMGFLFVSNAAFNNLGHPTYSTAFNWGRATLGTIPPVMLGTWLAGAKGALAGQAVGSALFGLLAILTCFQVIHRAHGQVKS